MPAGLTGRLVQSSRKGLGTEALGRDLRTLRPVMRRVTAAFQDRGREARSWSMYSQVFALEQFKLLIKILGS